CNLDVEGDLEGPALVGARELAGSLLVDHAEAAGAAGTARQAVRLAVDGEIALDGRVVVRVDDRDRLRGGRGVGQRVRLPEVGGTEARRSTGRQRVAAGVGDDVGVAACRIRRARADRVVVG